MRRRTIVIVVIVLIVAVAATVGVKTFAPRAVSGAMPNHITVAAAKAGGPGEIVKVGGDVMPGSIRWNGASGSLGFVLSGEGDQMQVFYPGTAPKDFKPGSEVVVEGSYTPDGAFQASSLTTTNSPLCKACHQ